MDSLDTGYEICVIKGEDRGKTIPLRFRELHLGRKSADDRESGWLHFAEPTVSRHHATIVWDETRRHYTLYHKSRTNPTLVNGRRVQFCPLTHDDVVQIGLLVFKVAFVGTEPTVALTPTRPSGMALPPEPRRQAEPQQVPDEDSVSSGLKLVVTEGPDRGSIFLLEKTVMFIGRREGLDDLRGQNGILLNDESLPREQVLLAWNERERTYGIFQMESSLEPTYIHRADEGRAMVIELASTMQNLLRPDDMLRMGSTAIVVAWQHQDIRVDDDPEEEPEPSPPPQRKGFNVPSTTAVMVRVLGPTPLEEEPDKSQIWPRPTSRRPTDDPSRSGTGRPGRYPPGGEGLTAAPFPGLPPQDEPPSPSRKGHNEHEAPEPPPRGRRGHAHEEPTVPQGRGRRRPEEEKPPAPNSYGRRRPEEEELPAPPISPVFSRRAQPQDERGSGRGTANPVFPPEADDSPPRGRGEPPDEEGPPSDSSTRRRRPEFTPGSTASSPRGGATDPEFMKNRQADAQKTAGAIRSAQGRSVHAQTSRGGGSADGQLAETRLAPGMKLPFMREDDDLPGDEMAPPPPRSGSPAAPTAFRRGPAPGISRMMRGASEADTPPPPPPAATGPSTGFDPSLPPIVPATLGELSRQLGTFCFPGQDTGFGRSAAPSAGPLSPPRPPPSPSSSSGSRPRPASGSTTGSAARRKGGGPEIVTAPLWHDRETLGDEPPTREGVAVRPPAGSPAGPKSGTPGLPKSYRPPELFVSEGDEDPEPDFASGTFDWKYRADYIVGFLEGSNRGQRVELITRDLLDGRQIPVGCRGERFNEIEIDDPGVVNRQALITYNQGRFSLVNEARDGSIFVNQISVRQREEMLLKTGDRIHMGESVLIFLERTVVQVLSRYELIVLAGVTDDRFKTFDLPKEVVIVGRLRSCDIVLADAEVSRKHLAITLRGGRFYITHLSSSNPTFINGVSLPRGRDRILNEGDKIQLSDHTTVLFRLRPPSQEQDGNNDLSMPPP